MIEFQNKSLPYRIGHEIIHLLDPGIIDDTGREVGVDGCEDELEFCYHVLELAQENQSAPILKSPYPHPLRNEMKMKWRKQEKKDR